MSTTPTNPETARAMTSAILRGMVDRALPEDGDFRFRSFPIDESATGYNVGSGWVPLTQVGRARCAVAVLVGKRKRPTYVWTLEHRLDDMEPDDLAAFERNVRDGMTMLIENMLADATGTAQPHGRLCPSLTDREFETHLRETYGVAKR